MKFDWIDILGPPIIALLVSLLGWGASRSINVGRPLTPIQRSMLLLAFWLMLGIGYSMMIVGAPHWPHWTWIPPTILWALFLGFLAWRRCRRQSAGVIDGVSSQTHHPQSGNRGTRRDVF